MNAKPIGSERDDFMLDVRSGDYEKFVINKKCCTQYRATTAGPCLSITFFALPSKQKAKACFDKRICHLRDYKDC